MTRSLDTRRSERLASKLRPRIVVPSAQKSPELIHPEYRLEHLRRGVLDRAHVENSGAVDEHVDAAKFGLRFGDGRTPVLCRADIERNQARLVAELTRQGLTGVFPDIGEHDPCTQLHETAGDDRAGASAGTGHEYDLSLER